MFTWICPQCGSEVPPSENDCPNCRARAAAQPPPPVAAQTAEPASASPGLQPTPVAAPPARSQTTWPPALVALASAVVMVAVLAILYLYVLPRNPVAPAATALEAPGPAGSATQAHPLAKYIEIVGVRVREGARNQARISYVVVNQSPASLPELEARISLMAGDTQVFDFPTRIPSLGPYEARDLTTSMKTDLRPYELPDWQALRTRFQITAER